MDSEVYRVKDIMVKLDVSKNIAYDIIKQGLFPVITIKGTYRIPKKGFDAWLNGSN
jgi:hypothetical protein